MLTNIQKKFLLDEFNITETDLRKMTVDEWREVRVKCFICESDETELDEMGAADISEKGIIAAAIADTKFKDIFTVN